MQNLNQQKGIISLAVIFTVGFFAISLVMINSLGVLGELKKNRNTVLGDQSFYTAEAAAAEGAYQFINDTSYLGGSFTSTQLLNNTLAGNTVVSSTWPYTEVISEAENNLTQREVVYNLIVYPEGLAFTYAIYSNNNLDFHGNAYVEGNIFANNDIDFHGSAEVNGNAYSSSSIEDVDNITGEIYPNLGPVPPPQIDLLPYEIDAQGNGTFFATSNDAELYLNGNEIGSETAGEVIFVDQATSKTQVQGSNTSLHGSLVIRNDLDITGGTYSATDNYAALVILGDLKLAGGAVINGIVYVEGSTSFGAGGGTINGSLISTGEINDTDLTGNADIIFDDDIMDSWQTLMGLTTSTSTSTPRIIDWGEN